MNILVTGGAGFIASHIVDAYVALGHHVVIVDNLSSGKEKNIHPKARFYKEDIRSANISTIFKKEKISLLNHHAAQIDIRKSVSDPIFDAQVNIEGSLNLFQNAYKNGIKKIIFASSGGAIYGDTDTLPTPENNYPYRPASPYGIAKLTIEYYLDFYYHTYGLSYTALRYGNVYGPRQDPFGEAGVVAIFCQKMLQGDQPVIHGDGEQLRDFVFVKDVAAANVKSLDTSFIGGVNIGTAKATSVNMLIHTLAHLLKLDLKEKHGPEKVGEQKKSILLPKLAEKKLGWMPKTSLSDGLKQTLDYFRVV